MNIKVIGMGCDKCDALYDRTLEAVALSGLEAQVEKVTDLVEIVRLGVLSAPGLMVEGKLLAAGTVPSVKAIVKLLKEASHG